MFAYIFHIVFPYQYPDTSVEMVTRVPTDSQDSVDIEAKCVEAKGVHTITTTATDLE